MVTFFIIIASFAEPDLPSFQYFEKAKFQTRAACEEQVASTLHNIKATFRSQYLRLDEHRIFHVSSLAHNGKMYIDAKLTCVEVTVRN